MNEVTQCAGLVSTNVRVQVYLLVESRGFLCDIVVLLPGGRSKHPLEYITLRIKRCTAVQCVDQDIAHIHVHVRRVYLCLALFVQLVIYLASGTDGLVLKVCTMYNVSPLAQLHILCTCSGLLFMNFRSKFMKSHMNIRKYFHNSTLHVYTE